MFQLHDPFQFEVNYEQALYYSKQKVKWTNDAISIAASRLKYRQQW